LVGYQPQFRGDRHGIFYPGPFLLDPAADLVLIALHGPALGLLGAPSQGVQETTDMVDMVAQPESVLDELSYPGAGPQVGFESGCLGSFEQGFFQSTPGFIVQPPRTTGGRPGLDALAAALPEGGAPTPNAPSVTTDNACDFHREMVFLQQLNGSETTTFEILRASRWPHRTPPVHRIGHLLCRVLLAPPHDLVPAKA
jgi:hypothetical protein